MATTLAMMVMTGRGVLVAHIGDSPILQLRPHEGTIFRTSDHSLVAEMVARGDITAEDALQHPQRNIITRCMFVPDRQRRISQATVDMIADVRPGDVFLLCSDGVNGAERGILGPTAYCRRPYAAAEGRTLAAADCRQPRQQYGVDSGGG